MILEKNVIAKMITQRATYMVQRKSQMDTTNRIAAAKLETRSDEAIESNRHVMMEESAEEELDDIPWMLLTFDGDFPQINALLSTLIEKYAHLRIWFWKFPGGCSLTTQPNDLMRSFMIIHGYINGANYQETQTYADPSHLNFVASLLDSIEMDKASVDTYKNFFRQIGVIESNAFRRSVILEGYRIAGINPPSVIQILSMCPAWANLSTTDAQRVLDAIEVLTVPARLTGITDENLLNELIGDIAQTEVVNMTNLTIVRQRAMIFNGSAVWEMRRADDERKLEAERLKKLAKEEKDRKAKLREERERAKQEGRPPDSEKAGPPTISCYCSGQCSTNNYCNAGDELFGKEWKGCSTCTFWYCNKKGCEKAFLKHNNMCSARSMI